VYHVPRISLHHEGRQTVDSASSRSRSVEGLKIMITYLVLKISSYRESRQTTDSPSIHRVDRVSLRDCVK
jgi:hypothetical protein